MSLRDQLLPVIDSLRALPNTFGLRRYSVTLRARTWAGAYPGELAPTDTDTTISPPPKVRYISSREVASSGGTYREGDIKLEKITPSYTGATSGGYTPGQLNLRPGSGTNNQDVAVILTGDQGSFECEVVEVNFDRPFNYWMVVRQVRGAVRG